MRTTPLINKNTAVGVGFGEGSAKPVFGEQADESDRDRRENEQPCEALIGVAISRRTTLVASPRDDAHPVAPEVDDQRDGGSDVQSDDEREVRRFRS